MTLMASVALASNEAGVQPALSFQGVSKSYRGPEQYGALRDSAMDALKRMVGIRRPPRRVVDALRDVTFEVPDGKAVALIGENGAGKTTALKLASRISYPTSGVVRVRGRVGALIEVGTGLHPELTGRENIQLYGRILGHTGRDIARRFDEIVEFADIGHAIGQPVKQYSSGMQLRLGFSVAAHLEPDVFLVDEALAVGDAGFQARCVRKMSQLVREGRSLLFISHDMTAVESVCAAAILLRDGRIVAEGPAADVVRAYLLHVQESIAEPDGQRPAEADELRIDRVDLLDRSGRPVEVLGAGEPLTVRLHYVARSDVIRPLVTLGIREPRIGVLALASMLIDGNAPSRLAGSGHIDCVFEGLPFQPRTYEIWGSVRGSDGYGDLVSWQRLSRFRMGGEVGTGKSAVTLTLDNAPVRVAYQWRWPEER